MEISKVYISKKVIDNVLTIKYVKDYSNRVIIRSLSDKSQRVSIITYNSGDHLSIDMHIDTLFN